jgi:hypothetical protein
MWKIITIVVAVVCLAAAGFLFWDGHQAPDDASAAAVALADKARIATDQLAREYRSSTASSTS